MSEVQNVVALSSDWLLARQHAPTGGWAEQPGHNVNVLNTAEAMIALLGTGQIGPADARIQRGVQFLTREQLADGPDRGAWPRIRPQPDTEQKVPDVVRTSFALEALIKAGVTPSEEPSAAALAWLLGLQTPEGGWGFHPGADAALMPTCFALGSLLAAFHVGSAACRTPIENGVAFLVTTFRNEERSFGEKGPLEAVHTIYAVLVLQDARRHGIGSYSKQERGAIDWLREHPDAARRLVEERMTIDPAGHADYGFLFMTDTLLLRALMGSEDSAHRSSELARNALISLRDKLDESGGFYGYRVFSWSTAKAISALTAAVGEYQAFPIRKPEPSGPGTGHLVYGFAFAILAVVVVLLALDKFTTTAAGVFVFLTLAVLLGYRFIGEKTFKELASGKLGLGKSS